MLTKDDKDWLTDIFATNRTNHRILMDDFRSHVDSRFQALSDRLGLIEPSIHVLQTNLDGVHTRLEGFEQRLVKLEKKRGSAHADR